LLGALVYRLAALEQNSAVRTSEAPNLHAMGQIIASGSALVAKLRSFGRTPVARPGTIDLGPIVATAVAVAQSEMEITPLEERPIRIVTALPSLPNVNGYADDLCNVFLNLLLNARDAMPSGGTIRIGAQVEGGAVVVRVEDEGTGIAGANLSRIFEPFFSTKGANGTGIGLAVARETMGRIGGSITAQNRPEGGACFELRFVTS
jgi:signal transduction histidine kinase